MMFSSCSDSYRPVSLAPVSHYALVVSAAGLLCDPGADAAVLGLPEDSLQASPLCSCAGVFVGGGSHGRGRHSGRKRPGVK